MKENFNKDAYTQAYIIVKFLLEIGEIVVPENLLNVLEKRRNINYQFDLNDIKNIQLNPDTEKILTIVYIECIANHDDRNKIKKATKTLRKIIINEEEKDEKINKKLLPVDINSLKWNEKIKIKLRKMLSLSIPRIKFNN